ncbi:hypothetical protein [Phenylobacterium sp.]|uniref:hypothetical protein n=1 Tax=Phenylobacterium sp. TaxID=1871053 RepID=UPI002E2EB94F|nr:hypothetical protein [Phenylobacterium sp.]HEX2559051.1 hypothetical protein [Phenylobacterium sp.]
MTALVPAAPAQVRPASALPSAPWLTGLLIYATLLFAPQTLNDGDTYWHLAAGEWMLAHGEVLHADPFSYTFAGKPWTTHEWLSEIVMGLVFRAGGWGGVMALTAAAAALAGALVAGYLRPRLGLVPLTLTLLLGLACLAPGLLARPHVLAFPVLAAWAIALLRARDEGRAPSLLLLPLMAVWANLHGSFVLGLALIGPFALEALIEGRARPWPVVRAWGLFGLGALAAAALTPHGPQGLIFPFQLMGMATAPTIDEWRSLDFSDPQPLEFGLMALLLVGFSRGLKVPPLRLILLLGLLHMSLQHGRHAMVLGLLAPLLLADPLRQVTTAAEPLAPPSSLSIGLVIALIAGLTAGRMAAQPARIDALTTPATALAAVPADIARQPVLNEYGFGGYLIFAGLRPFIDGRADMYGDDFIRTYDRAVSGNPEALAETLERHGVRWTILHPGNRAVPVLDRTPGWRRLHADAYAVVHVKDAPGAMALRGAVE